jgi:AcrR family transcriptional regulator
MRRAMLSLLAEMPLEQVTGALVAGRAGVGYATYFRHYRNVRELLVDTVAELAEELAARMLAPMIAGDSAAAARVLTSAVAERREVFASLLGGAGDETRGVLTRHIVERTAQFPDLSPPWLPHRLALRFAIAGTVEVLDWWLHEAPERTADDVAPILARLLIAPLQGGRG